MPLTALPPPPPVVEQPASYEVSYGTVAGAVAPGTTRIVVRVGNRVLANLPLDPRRRRFQLRVDLPLGDTAVRVTALRASGRGASTTVRDVFGLPPDAAPRLARPRLDPLLQRDLDRAARPFGRTSAFYVQNLVTGAGAAANARAAFPAASTLKLAIAAAALARVDGVPAPGSSLGRLLRSMLIVSDDASANAVEAAIGGSVYGGSALVNSLMRSIGMTGSEMYGGYEVQRRTAAAIPLRVTDQPGWGVGKRTTAADLARLATSLWLASGNLGVLREQHPGFTAADGRHLLWLLAHVRDPGKLDRHLRGRRDVRVLHKAGWISRARHDHGLVVWPGGVLVVAVMTYRGGGVGTSSDALAGLLARTALDRFRG